MKLYTRLFAALAVLWITAACSSPSPRTSFMLEEGWKFTRQDNPQASDILFDDSKWESVTVPHDWAIYGPFSADYDAQKVAISQNMEKQATLKTGRTGGLPYMGTGWYRRSFNVPDFDDDRHVELLFDGAMSDARVYVNGIEVCYWPYGYNAFHCDVTHALHKDGKKNILAVRLENLPQSSRWYPGAGLYRNVHVISTHKTHIPVWGTHITTPVVSPESAQVELRVHVETASPAASGTADFKLRTAIVDPNGNVVATCEDTFNPSEQPIVQQATVPQPLLWSPETPHLYQAQTTVIENGETKDCYTTTFGIRTVELIPERGFYLNGQLRKFQGVCNHHDLGPLGAAINTAALRRQLTLLKEMGCDAIRTSHNMPAPELVELCDQMGFMMMVEPFDEWNLAKCRNGYHRLFDQWAEKDMVNMLHHFRNNASVVMWSIGNEVPGQCEPIGYETAKFLRDICHREDPTRPVTCGMDQVACVLKNQFATLLDVPGLNYRVPLYQEAFDVLPQKLVLGSETGSTVSSRGVYHFPDSIASGVTHPDHQSSSYDVEACWWSNLPDLDFAMAEDYEWTIGQFVWTGFDYLGEPTPYDQLWPNHSSMFGIIDLASLPKDRYYLYRSVWRPDVETLHILPHWNWENRPEQPGREGKITPVYVYTNHPGGELFVNGKSYGQRFKNDSTLQHRYRLMWDNVIYEPGEIKVVALDAAGQHVGEQVMRTAGAAYTLELVADRTQLTADGKDLAYVTVRVVDKNGVLCPTDNRLVSFTVEGAGTYRAGANGDPTCLDAFHEPAMHAFSGQLTALVQTTRKSGSITLTATAPGLQAASLTLTSQRAE